MFRGVSGGLGCPATHIPARSIRKASRVDAFRIDFGNAVNSTVKIEWDFVRGK